MTSPGWYTCEASDVADGSDWLSPKERSVEAGLRFAKRRGDWRLGRWAAKQAVLGAAVGDQSAHVEVIAAGDGAPEVHVHGEAAPVSLSVSHRAGRALVAVAPSPAVVGCDLELVEPHGDAFLADWFGDDERAAVAAADDPVLTVNLLWSVKEAVAKCLREGLRLDVRHIAARPDLDAETVCGWRAVEAAVDGAVLQGWWRRLADSVAVVVATPSCEAPHRLPGS